MKNILVVGLKRADTDGLHSLLQKEGYNVKGAENCELTLNVLKFFTPDVLICIHDPAYFDGFKFLNESSNHPEIQAIRKIVISEQGDRISFRKAMALGADDFIPQPYEIFEIIEAIEAQLKRSEQLHTQVVPYPQQNFPIPLTTQAELKQQFSELKTKADTPETFSKLYLIGIDQLNWLRSTLGSQLSDTILELFAKRLITSTQALNDALLISSIDNQQFAILPSLGQEALVEEALNEAWQQSISTPIAIEKQEIQIHTSIAAIEFPIQDSCDFEMVIGQARQVLKRISKQGGNQFQSESLCQTSHSSYQFTIATNLLKGIEDDEFHAYYQPQVDLQTGQFVGVEALVRWHHKQWGTLEPGRFIPIAEETSIIMQIDERVLRLACQAVQKWQRASFSPLKVSVNLSALSFNRPNLAGLVEGILQEFDVSPEWVELEITESMLVQDTANSAQIMQDLKSIGVSIALDDFGIGYSSLSYLQQFPLDTLKIDRCFINKVDKNRGNAAITEAVIKLAHDLGLNVIAEGVERVEEREFLKKHDCDAMQGYLVSHPVPRSVFEILLASQAKQRLTLA